MVLFQEQDMDLMFQENRKKSKLRSRKSMHLILKDLKQEDPGNAPLIVRKSWIWEEWALRTGVSLNAYQGVSRIGIYTDFT